jgi:hypothetical protein
MSFNGAKRQRRNTALYCGHCAEVLSRAAYWKHRKAYYNPRTEKWTTKEFLELQRCKRKQSHDLKKTENSLSQDDITDLWPSVSSDDDDLETIVKHGGKESIYKSLTLLKLKAYVFILKRAYIKLTYFTTN